MRVLARLSLSLYSLSFCSLETSFKDSAFCVLMYELQVNEDKVNVSTAAETGSLRPPFTKQPLVRRSSEDTAYCFNVRGQRLAVSLTQVQVHNIKRIS